MRYLCSLFVFSISCVLVLGRPGDRIVRGSPAADHEFPALASLRVNGSHWCGLNVLDSDWLLTAAHCVLDKTLSELSVLSGTNSQSGGGTYHLVEQFIIHANYSIFDKTNDIALVKVSPQLSLDGVTVAPVSLPTQGQQTQDRAPAVVAGWGHLSGEYGNDTMADWLQKLDTIIINNEECQEDYNFNLIFDDMICSGSTSGGICGGDSGGPLYVDGQLVGLTSFTLYCGGITPPSVFTRVSSYIDWINEQIA